MRLPSFHKDDFIKYGDKILQIKKIGSHKFACVNLKDYTTESISWKEYDNVSKVAEMCDVKKSMVTNITPKIIQILDPDTYSTVEFEKHENHDKINIGEEIDVIKIEEKIYIID